jgi:hypothetical protein
MFVLHKKGAVAVKSSTFTPSLRAAAPVAAATGRATRAMPATIVMAEAKKSVKDLPASALQGKKVCFFIQHGTKTADHRHSSRMLHDVLAHLTSGVSEHYAGAHPLRPQRSP